MFMEQPLPPIRCEQCNKIAGWRVYNKKMKKVQYYCTHHVPPIGTPRIKEHLRIQQNRGGQ